MKVYIVMRYDHEEYEPGEVFYNESDARKLVQEDIMGFDYVAEREVRGLP